MKTPEAELEELIDMVIKLTWYLTVFRALFANTESDGEVRAAHPELFLTLHDSLLCAFCVGSAVIFDDKAKATSVWTLINRSKPELAAKLKLKINDKKKLITVVEALRHQVFAHRFQAKSPADVFAEVHSSLGQMAEVVKLANLVICELLAEIDPSRRAELENQQLSAQTLEILASDAHLILKALR